MTRERLREIARKAAYELLAWLVIDKDWNAPGANILKQDEYELAVEKLLPFIAAGERLGREDADSVYWPALCEQWRIEFGKELRQEGGHIMNIIDGVRELLRAERERIRDVIITDKTTCSGDYSEAEECADRIVGKETENH